MTLDVLVFGRTGQVARELRRAGWPSGTSVTFLDREAADLGDPHKLGTIVASRRPDIVIIAAGYTAVDRAERDEALATVVNAAAPGVIAAAAADVGAAVIHLSTDYVFDGAKPSAYVETDPAAPLNAYGRSKLAGERSVMAANPRHIVLRTSWLYSAEGYNFVRKMLRLAATQEHVNVVHDQIGCPTSARDLAAALVDLSTCSARSEEAPFGVYHLAGATEASWCDFAEAIMAEAARHGLPRRAVRPVTTDAFPAAARRPRNSRLACGRIEAAFGLRLPGFPESLPATLAEMMHSP